MFSRFESVEVPKIKQLIDQKLERPDCTEEAKDRKK